MPPETVTVHSVNENEKAQIIDLLMQRIHPLVKAHVENWLSLQLPEPSFAKPSSNPFAIRYSDFVKLTEKQARTLHEKIYRENYSWIEGELDRRKAQWMIVVNGKVTRSSRVLDNIPTAPQLELIGKKTGFLPFLFVRNVPIEESTATTPDATRWVRISGKDFYPTITLLAGKPEWPDSRLLAEGKTFIADFDTGCPAIIIDAETLGSEFQVATAAKVQGLHLSQTYWFSILQVKIAVHLPENKIRAKRITARVVEAWKHGPFKAINPRRKALCGRTLISDLLLKILLDGEKRRTLIVG